MAQNLDSNTFCCFTDKPAPSRLVPQHAMTCTQTATAITPDLHVKQPLIPVRCKYECIRKCKCKCECK